MFSMCTQAQPEPLSCTRPNAFAASREPATIGRIGMAARLRGGGLTDRFGSLTMPLKNATPAPRAFDVNQEGCLPSFSGNRVGC
jgi:hypothetical protein